MAANLLPVQTSPGTYTGVIGNADVNPAVGTTVYDMALLACQSQLYVEASTGTKSLFSGPLVYEPKTSNKTCEDNSLPHSPPINCTYAGVYTIAPLGCVGTTNVSHALSCLNDKVLLRSPKQAAGDRLLWTINGEGRTQEVAIVANKGTCPASQLTGPTGSDNIQPILTMQGAFIIVPVEYGACDVVYLKSSARGSGKQYLATNDDCRSGFYWSDYTNADPLKKRFAVSPFLLTA